MNGYWILVLLAALLIPGVPLLDWWLGSRARRQRRQFKRFMQGRL